jgi:hypothetical protein
MSALGSALLLCGWVAGVVAAVATIRCLEHVAWPAGPQRRPIAALSGVVLVSLWLPWVESADGQLTLPGWSGLDAATVVAVVLLTAGIATLALFPDRGGDHRDLLSMTLSLSLVGIVGGNVLLGASGAWENELSWGAAVTLVATVALAGCEVRHRLQSPADLISH